VFDLPIAQELSAVSVSHLSAEAGQALQACSITDKEGYVPGFGFGVVGGMAEVTPASDAVKYVPLWGIEREIQTEAPAWVISVRGDVVLPPGTLTRNPTCVVVNGEHAWYDTGESFIDDKWMPAKDPPNWPTARLPPLAP
jgi:hypothetical protein